MNMRKKLDCKGTTKSKKKNQPFISKERTLNKWKNLRKSRKKENASLEKLNRRQNKMR